MRRIELLSGVTVLALGFLSAVPATCATELPEVDANGKAIGETLTLDPGVSTSSPFLNRENLSLAVESQAEAAKADNLAKQLANPIASLISVPFQANEDCQPVPQQNFED